MSCCAGLYTLHPARLEAACPTHMYSSALLLYHVQHGLSELGAITNFRFIARVDNLNAPVIMDALFYIESSVIWAFHRTLRSHEGKMCYSWKPGVAKLDALKNLLHIQSLVQCHPEHRMPYDIAEISLEESV